MSIREFIINPRKLIKKKIIVFDLYRKYQHYSHFLPSKIKSAKERGEIKKFHSPEALL